MGNLVTVLVNKLLILSLIFITHLITPWWSAVWYFGSLSFIDTCVQIPIIKSESNILFPSIFSYDP